MATNINSVLPFSWDAVQGTNQWRELTAQQRIWCLAWIANGHDHLKATQLAYKCASPRNTACLSYEVRRHKNIVRFLELYEVLTQGAPSREEQIAGVLDTIREAPAYSQIHARRLLAQLTGCVESEAEPDANPVVAVKSPVRVGDIVLVDGVKHRVTKLDANGRPTDGEPL